MRRAAFATALFMTLVAVLPAQRRDRDRDFGLSQDAWCDQERRADICEVREETIPNASVIDLDARGNGGVVVRGWNRQDARLRARVAVWADSASEARRLADQVRVIVQGGSIRSEPQRSDRNGGDWGRDRNWSIAYELQVPYDTHLTVEATNGGVVVGDVRGKVDARTVNGGIVMNDVSGDIDGETVNGGVVLSLSQETWHGAGLNLKTVNGGIQVSVPSDFSAELDARASNGGIRVDLPMTVSGPLSRRQIRGTLGSGGPRMVLTTVNGGVSLTRR